MLEMWEMWETRSLRRVFHIFHIFNACGTMGEGGRCFSALVFMLPPSPSAVRLRKVAVPHLLTVKPCKLCAPAPSFAGYIKNLHCLIFFDILKLVNQF